MDGYWLLKNLEKILWPYTLTNKTKKIVYTKIGCNNPSAEFKRPNVNNRKRLMTTDYVF